MYLDGMNTLLVILKETISADSKILRPIDIEIYLS